MSEAEKGGNDEPGMGIVKKRRSRKLLEKRDVGDTKTGHSTSSAAAAWGDMLEQQVREGEDPTPPPTVDETPAVLDDHGATRRVQPRARHTSRRRKQELPDILKDTPIAGMPKGATRRGAKKIEDVVGSIAEQQENYDERAEFEGAASFSLRKSRLWLSVLALLVATGGAAYPVYGELARREQAVLLQSVLQGQASRVAAAFPNVPKLVQAEDLPALREIYAKHHPGAVRAVQAAGFQITDRQVTLRADFTALALVFGVGIEQDDGDPIAAQASTTGRPVGRPLAEASLSAALRVHAEDVVTFYLMAVVLMLGMFFGPALVDRLEARRARADARRRAAEEQKAFEEATREG